LGRSGGHGRVCEGHRDEAVKRYGVVKLCIVRAKVIMDNLPSGY
jgi:hypothetical protein